MDWIWSSRCLELLCTSTQSSHLKWVSGGGINSPRHPKSRWLTATEKVSIEWTEPIFFKASVHPMPLPRHLAVEILWHNCSDAIHRRCVGSSGAEDHATKSSLLAFTGPSDRPTLPLYQGVGSSGAEDFVLARLCINSNWASDRPTVSTLKPSDHPVLLSLLLLLCNSSDASRNWTVGSSDGINFVLSVAQCTNYTDAMHRWYRRFIRRFLLPSFSSRLQLGSLLQLNIINILNIPLLIASKYILSPQICYK
jgi:hypothetical protein